MVVVWGTEVPPLFYLAGRKEVTMYTHVHKHTHTHAGTYVLTHIYMHTFVHTACYPSL